MNQYILIDGLEIQENSEFDFDLCIIGAGATGISIARTFKTFSKKVCLLESGGFDFSKERTIKLNDWVLSKTEIQIWYIYHLLHEQNS